MKTIQRWSVLMVVSLGGLTLSSCTTGWLIPSRNAAVNGLSDYIKQGVFNILTGFLPTDEITGGE